MALLWRVFATNAAVLVAATLVLVLTPATVSFPVAAQEAVVLAVGMTLLLGLDFVLLRRAVGVDALQRVRTALAAQEGERARVARELHDEVGQALTAVLLSLEHVRGEQDLAEAREAARAALDDVRSIARRLRPEALDDLGLASALAALSVSVQSSTGLRVERALYAPAGGLSDEEELVAYRVAQEALTNVARHAQASRAVLRTAALPDGGLALEVADDGCGFDPGAQTAGAGLLGMRERAELVGARLRIGSAPGAGTTVRLEIGR